MDRSSIHADHLNTPRRLSNAAGQPVWQWTYSLDGDVQPTKGVHRFADPATNPGTGAVADVRFNLRFPGQYYDEESGLNYNYFRSYDSRTGRYTQADPIGLGGGWNRFGYAGANALSRIDPRGLWEISIDFYRGTGGGISFGRDPATGQGFLSCKWGLGVGGGISYDPLGGRPGGPKASAGSGGATLGLAVDAGAAAELFGFGISGVASGSRGYDFGGEGRPYNDPSLKGTLGYSQGGRTHIGVMGSIAVQGSLYDAGKAGN